MAMRTTASLLLLATGVALGIVLPAAGYCDLSVVHGAGVPSLRLVACGSQPDLDLDDAYWAVNASFQPIAAALAAISLLVLAWKRESSPSAQR